MAFQAKNFLGIGLVLGIAGVAGLVYGGHKTSLALKNSEPTRMKYAEWVKAPPDKEWVILEDVEIIWGYSTKITTTTTRKGRKTGETHEYFVAGNVNADDDAEKIKAFFIVDDAAKCAFMEECWRNENNLNWYEQNQGRLVEKVTIEGMVQTGLSLSSEDEKILRNSGGPVDTDFKIVKWGEKPDGGTGFFLLFLGVLGIAAAGGVGFLGIRAHKKEKAGRSMPMPQGPYPQGQYPGPGMPQPGMPPQGPVPYGAPQPGMPHAGPQPMHGHPHAHPPGTPPHAHPQRPMPQQPQRPMPQQPPQARPMPPRPPQRPPQ